MQSQREDMREILEKAVIIESAKTDSGFKYTYASKEAYKTVFIRNDLFYCIRGLTDPHNSCEKEYRYSLQEIDKVLDFMFLEKELEEKDPKLADFFEKEQLDKEANVKMLNSLLKDIEEKRKEISEDLQKHKLCDDRLLYSGQLKGYNVLKNHIIQIKKNL